MTSRLAYEKRRLAFPSALNRRPTRFNAVAEQNSRGAATTNLFEALAPDFRLCVESLRTFAKAEDADVLDAEGKAIQRRTRLEAGAVGRMLERNALPLEDGGALQKAIPVKDGKIVVDADAIQARRRVMVEHLPTQGLAKIVLGGSDDLRDVVPEGALYLRVTSRSYSGN